MYYQIKLPFVLNIHVISFKFNLTVDTEHTAQGVEKHDNWFFLGKWGGTFYLEYCMGL